MLFFSSNLFCLIDYNDLNSKCWFFSNKQNVRRIFTENSLAKNDVSFYPFPITVSRQSIVLYLFFTHRYYFFFLQKWNETLAEKASQISSSCPATTPSFISQQTEIVEKEDGLQEIKIINSIDPETLTGIVDNVLNEFEFF